MSARLNTLLRPKTRHNAEVADFNRILVPVSGGKADAGAIEMACSLAGCKGKKTIIAVHVIPVERCLPLDAEIEAALGRAEGVMAAVEKQVEKLGHLALTDILQARDIGSAIVQASREHCADLILISLNCKTAFVEFRLGNLVHHILKNAPRRVILNYEGDREPAE
jgi:hypothetical protein